MTSQLPYSAEAIGTVPPLTRRHYGFLYTTASRTARSSAITMNHAQAMTVSTWWKRWMDRHDGNSSCPSWNPYHSVLTTCCETCQSVALETRSVALETRSVALETRSVALETQSVVLETRSVVLETQSVALEMQVFIESLRVLLLFESLFGTF